MTSNDSTKLPEREAQADNFVKGSENWPFRQQIADALGCNEPGNHTECEADVDAVMAVLRRYGITDPTVQASGRKPIQNDAESTKLGTHEQIAKGNVEITDEMVARAQRAYFGPPPASISEPRQWMRKALEAALNG